MRVTGDSMVPVLNDGDHVLVDPHVGALAPGDLVQVRHPDRPELVMVKRVVAVLPDGRLDLRGDNPAASTDSRQFGPVAPDRVRGRVVWRFAG